MSAQGPDRATDNENTKLDWETPPLFVAWRNSIWNFDLDAAANNENCAFGDDRFFGPDSPYLEDALCPHSAWSEHGNRFWCNPPYGRGIENWIRQFDKQARLGSFIEALLPANTDTQWFALCKETAAEIELLSGRIQFWHDGKPSTTNSNTSGSMLVRWRKGKQGASISLTDWREEMKK